MANFKTSDWLNLRSEPIVQSGNILVVMPPDTVVEKIETGSFPEWFRVKVRMKNTEMQGFASAKFLEETTPPVNEPEDDGNIPEAHLVTSRIIERGNVNGRAFPLNEPSFKKLKLAELTAADRKLAIHQQLDYLNVERSKRYLPGNGSTFCNIYAHDLAYSLGLYVPRVWWTPQAVTKIQQGTAVDVIYEKTVTELNANALANWFENFGHHYKWKRRSSVDELQTAVNEGTLGIIVAQRINLGRSGHILGVVPEKTDQHATRDSGKVVSPLMSQAGVTNKKYFTGSKWWINPGLFRKFSFWSWEG